MISRIGNARRIAAALVVAMLVAGCTHETYIVDAKHPEVEYSEDGSLKWHGRFIQPEELPHLLEKSGVDHKSQIDIRVPYGIRSLKEPRILLFILRRAGYTRGVLVTEKKAYSHSSMPPPKQLPPPPPQRKIRYK